MTFIELFLCHCPRHALTSQTILQLRGVIATKRGAGIWPPVLLLPPHVLLPGFPQLQVNTLCGGQLRSGLKIWHLKLNVQLVRPGRPCACGSVHPHQHGVSGFTAHARPLAMTRPLFCGHRVSDLLFLLPAACVIEVFVVSVLGSCFNM